MIRKKNKTILSLFKSILFLGLLISSSKVLAVEYISDTFFKISSLPNNQKPLITGYVNNKVTFDEISFDANLLLNDDSYIYSLEENNNLVSFRGSGGISYSGDSYLFSVGLLDSVSSKSFYNKLFLLPTYQFGVKAFSRLESSKSKYYTLTGAYIENNTAFSFLYLKSFLDDNLYLATSVTPSMQYSLSPNRSTVYYKDVSTIDGSLIYYDEYEGIGHGADLSLRQYFNTKDSSDTANDIAMGATLDYFGFSFKSHFLVGNNNFDLDYNQTNNYKAFENSLYYTISSLTVGAYYLNTNIYTNDVTYKTEVLELDLQYRLGENFILYSAMFYQDFKLDNNIGLLLGLSLSL